MTVHDERGSVTVVVVTITFALLMLGGLVFDGGRIITYAELPAAIQQMAGKLLAADCKRLAIAGDNSIEWIISDLAALSCGIPVIPLPPFFTAAQRQGVLESSGATHIALGAALVAEFHWVLYLFSAFLIFSGLKMLKSDHDNIDIEHNPLLKFLRRHVPVSNQLHGHDFFVKQTAADGSGRMVTAITPLMVSLILIEAADVIFAVDSVPAIFALTTDTYIIYTSNIFAILGLRTLYFALSAMMARFEYLKYALAAVLIFVGSKVFLNDFVFEGEKFPPAISLGVTFGLLFAGVAYSLWKTRKTA